MSTPPSDAPVPPTPTSGDPPVSPAAADVPVSKAASRWLTPDTRSRRLLIAAGIYVVCTLVFATVAGPERMAEHTAFNHYAHLADAWLHGRQDLRNGAPSYAGGNDFAEFEGKTYISFPPFPAVLMMPLVAIAGSPENFRDGQFIVWLAGLGPALLFLVLEKLRRTGRSSRGETYDAALALLFAFGSVYFFTAVEGTVWFAAHVIGVALAAGYALAALDAEAPWVAGLLIACGCMTRPSLSLTVPLFALEAIRVCCKDGLPAGGDLEERALETWRRVDKSKLARAYAAFAAPILVVLGIAGYMNYARFHNPSPFAGHEYLGVVWRTRIERWGLFGYHYLPKNLGAMLTILPWLPPHGARAAAAAAPFQINEHGLALWFTTPLYFWLLRPRRRGFLYDVTLLTAALPLVMDLLYQNSGWRQFGYRFSNDYAVLLFMLLALGDRAAGWSFRAAAAWGLAWNLFGAITFDRGGPADRYYFREGTQTVLYQPD